jgi:serine/threonine protein kinase
VAHGDLEATAGVREGEILAGKYRVDKILGAGGMGIVVAARHLQLDTKVAIKFLLPAMVENPEAVSRFAREARAAVRITSEHVARVLDVGTLVNGAPYMVMEFLEGGDLGAWVRQRGAMPIEQAVDFVLQACVAVAEAHALGIVHRDLKPSNLFCIRRADGQLTVKVLDFGISKVTAISASIGPSFSATQTSAVMGSPLYMSPEQMTSARDVDARTDIWALGIILHELLTGSAPFQGDTLPEMCIKIATQSPTTLRSVRPEAPARLEAIILKCLEKDRQARYRHVGDLALALSEFGPARAGAMVDRILGILQGSGQRSESTATGIGSRPMSQGGATLTSPGSIPPFGATNAGTKRRKTAGRIGLACGFAAVAAAAFLFVRPHSMAPRADDPPVAAVGKPTGTPQEPSAAIVPTSTSEGSWQTAPTRRGASDPDVPAEHGVATAPSAAPSARTTRRRAAPPAQPAVPSGGASASATTPSPAAHPPSAANCDPPFFFDEQGNRVFKQECVN